MAWDVEYRYYRFDPRWDDVDPIELGGRVYYGHLIEDPNGEWLEVPLTFWGDYYGSTVERSNYRVLLDEYRNHVVDVYGGHGTAGLLVSRGWFASEEGEEFREIVEGLDDYPVVNEDDWSDLESDMEYEYFHELHGLAWELRGHAGLNVPEDMTDDTLWTLYHAAMGTTNMDPVFETATTVYVDVDALVPALHAILCAYAMREWQTEGDRHWLNVAMLGLLSVLNQDAAKTQCRQWNDHSHETMTERLRVCLEEALPYGWEVEVTPMIRGMEDALGYDTVIQWHVKVPRYLQ